MKSRICLFRCIVQPARGADIEISDNVCIDSEEGIRLSMGSSYNKIFDNEVVNTKGRESRACADLIFPCLDFRRDVE